MPACDFAITTPEGVSFHLTLAGPPVRIAAALVDYGLMGALFSAFTRLSGPLGLPLAFLVFALGPILYGGLFEWFWRGQTPGKRLLHLRVLDAEGLRLEWRQVATRNLARVLDNVLPFYLLGGLVALANARMRRIGDLLASTLVVRETPVPVPAAGALASPKYNSLLADPGYIYRLRRGVRPQEAGLLLDALLARPRLEPEARLRLYRELADYFAARSACPEPLRAGLSDESFLRDAADIVFRPALPSRKIEINAVKS